MDRPRRGPAGPAPASGTPVTSDLPGTAKIIEARNLEKSFGETPALRGASLSGLAAPSSAKTTIRITVR